jgi:adenine C2-methylase RlmN of 23S rRNA A2503 and tRNA A37
MGQGEPIYNLKNVIDSLNIFTNKESFNISKRKIVVSTSGKI